MSCAKLLRQPLPIDDFAITDCPHADAALVTEYSDIIHAADEEMHRLALAARSKGGKAGKAGKGKGGGKKKHAPHGAGAATSASAAAAADGDDDGDGDDGAVASGGDGGTEAVAAGAGSATASAPAAGTGDASGGGAAGAGASAVDPAARHLARCFAVLRQSEMAILRANILMLAKARLSLEHAR